LRLRDILSFGSSLQKATIFVLLTLILSGCFALKYQSSDQIDFAMKNAGRSSLDQASNYTSEGILSYIKGQFLLNEEKYSDAVIEFSKASKLSGHTSPFLHLKLAELHLKSGKLDAALKEAEAANSLSPDDVNVMLLYAGILDSLERSDEAEALYNKVIKKDPTKLDAFILLSGLYVKRSRFNESLALLKGYLINNPNEPVVHYFLARAHEIMQDLGNAEISLKKAYTLDPTNENIAIDYVRILLTQKKMQMAKKVCKEILEHDSKNILARKVLGQLLIGENKFEEALGHLEVLRTQEEDSTDTRFKIALIQIQRKRTVEAERELNIVLAKNADHHQARYYLATLLAGSGRRKEAATELLKIPQTSDIYIKSRIFAGFVYQQERDLLTAEKMVTEAYVADGKSIEILPYLVSILREAGKLAQASEMLGKAVAENPDKERIRFDYAIILHDLKQEDEAKAQMKKVIEINPNQTEALNFLAYGFAEQGIELDRALELIRKALEIRPNNGYYLDTLGWVYYQKGDFPQAVDTLTKAVEISGSDPTILEHLGDALVKIGEHEKANERYEGALKIVYAIIEEANEKQPKNSLEEDPQRFIDRLKKKLYASKMNIEKQGVKDEESKNIE
jgi:tetratricopeptide (TPR) repeat protein